MRNTQMYAQGVQFSPGSLRVGRSSRLQAAQNMYLKWSPSQAQVGSCAHALRLLTCKSSRTTPPVPLQEVEAALDGHAGVSGALANFRAAATQGNLVPLSQRILSDHLTPVLAYRCLVGGDQREAPSFLFESVVNGDQQGRYSFVGAQPSLEVVAKGQSVQTIRQQPGGVAPIITTQDLEDPLQEPQQLSSGWKPVIDPSLPPVFTGGWVGYCGYDTVRYGYKGKLPFSGAPPDDRELPDMHLALYNNVLVFDHATKLAYVIAWVHLDDYEDVDAAYEAGRSRVERLIEKITSGGGRAVLPSGRVSLDPSKRPSPPGVSNVTKQEFLDGVRAAQEHIQAGDIFQLVLSQRFERRTQADPFEIYRALRVVNPSPYMIYLQASRCILVASSPEILCRLDSERKVINRPLAGTRRRGATKEEDDALATELLADGKECSEHVMLLDLGRNDVGRVSIAGSVKVESMMDIEKYSHVMHISSTVTGKLLPELGVWDVLRAALPAGTVSGAPKVRAMQIIDELETLRRGPYGGGIGHVSFTGGMDMALALRTMVIPNDYAATTSLSGGGSTSESARGEWTVHLQAGAGLVADSVPESEYEETMNKAAALGRAIDLAEQAFVNV